MSQKNIKKIFLSANKKWGIKYPLKSFNGIKSKAIIPFCDNLKQLKIEDISASLTESELHTDGTFEIKIGNETKEFPIYCTFIEDLFNFFDLPLKNIISLPCTNWTNDINKLLRISHINNCTFRLKNGVLYSFYPMTTKTGTSLDFDVFIQCTKEILENIGENDLHSINHSEYGIEMNYISQKDRFDFDKLKSFDIETATAISVYENRENDTISFEPGATYCCFDRTNINCLKIIPSIIINKKNDKKERKINLAKSKIIENTTCNIGILPTKVIPKYAKSVVTSSGVKIELIITAISNLLVKPIKIGGLIFLKENMPCSEKVSEFILEQYFYDDNKEFTVFDVWMKMIDAAIIFENDNIVDYAGNFLNEKFKFWNSNR